MSRHTTTALVTIALVSLGGGLALGFLAGVGSTKAGQDFFQAMFETEKKAAISAPKTLRRPKFEVKYPSNWKIDTADPGHKPDNFFTIESPGHASCIFILGDVQVAADEALGYQLEQFAKLMPNPESSVPFDRLGSLTGKGRQLAGTVFGSPSLIKLFSHSSPNGTVVIIQQVAQEDSKLTAEGFQLIENSFRFLPATETP